MHPADSVAGSGMDYSLPPGAECPATSPPAGKEGPPRASPPQQPDRGRPETQVEKRKECEGEEKASDGGRRLRRPHDTVDRPRLPAHFGDHPPRLHAEEPDRSAEGDGDQKPA